MTGSDSRLVVWRFSGCDNGRVLLLFRLWRFCPFIKGAPRTHRIFGLSSSYASSECPPYHIQTHTSCICWVFLHCELSNGSRFVQSLLDLNKIWQMYNIEVTKALSLFFYDRTGSFRGWYRQVIFLKAIPSSLWQFEESVVNRGAPF